MLHCHLAHKGIKPKFTYIIKQTSNVAINKIVV